VTDESLFTAALALPAAERAAFLAANCPDPAVRRQVEELLSAADASNPLDHRPVDVEKTVHRTQQPPEPTASVGDRIGPYKLLEKIGEGGMGEVWVADQLEPIKRRVAVKLIKAGMDSRSVLGRFEAERQALAVMDHPNIAKVLDAGQTADGRPFFVMELVKGTPITEFADARKLTPKQRLELFVPVCQAIQHAHMKGIIHRDIKPSNVLVALHDETPVPKVIDFGVAKAVGQQLTEKTIYTQYGALVGTPAYMAPEQATFNQLDVDTRADVYALGVLLYELLAGSPPIEKDRLKKAALDEVLRIVREEEPPRPSQRLSTSQAKASIAATRGSEPAKLSALMKGELDWIVMKALEKDRTRRYETANGFAADVQRYLTGEPVHAVPPSVGYRLRKFVRKHRGPVIAATLVLLVLVAGIVGTSWGLIRAEQQRREAEFARAAEAERAEGERVANELARKRLAQVEKGADLLAGIFADLDMRAIKEAERPLDAVLAERLVRVAEQLDEEAVGDPTVVSALHTRLGLSLCSLGFVAQGLPLIEKTRARLLAVYGPDHPETLKNLETLAITYEGVGRAAEAVLLHEERLRLTVEKVGADHPTALYGQLGLGRAMWKAGRATDAIPVLEDCLRRHQRATPPDHPTVFGVEGVLAAAYNDAGRSTEAIPLLEKSLAGLTALRGPADTQNVMARELLARAYQQADRPADAVRLLEDGLRQVRAVRGADHPDTIRLGNSLANEYFRAGRPDEAVPIYEESLRYMRGRLGSDHPHTLSIADTLGRAYLAVGQPGKSLPLFAEFLAGRRKQLANAPSAYALSLAQVSLDLLGAAEFAAAEPYLRECVTIREKKEPNDWRTFNTQSMLGGALLGQKKCADAEPLLLKGYEGMKAREKTIPKGGETRIAEALDRLIGLYTATNKPDEVKKYQELRAKYPKPEPKK
jgi:non-specific serine/threonine protein kinase/serine/threonine-protein kinase